MVSDGSFKEGFGMAAFTVVCKVPFQHLLVMNMTPGQRDDIDSYCSELRGLYGVVATIEQVVAHHGITGSTIKVGSNCLVGLQ